MPKFGQLTVPAASRSGPGQVAMLEGGTWDATSITKIPGVKVGVAPTVKGPKGRSMISNSNANNIYVGTKNLDLDVEVGHLHGLGGLPVDRRRGRHVPAVDRQVAAGRGRRPEEGRARPLGLRQRAEQRRAVPGAADANGQEIADTIQPLFEAYFSGEKDKSVFPELAAKTQEILAKQ